ncbi:MAG: type II secretion system F family protein [Oscillospiraceae bacterium]
MEQYIMLLIGVGATLIYVVLYLAGSKKYSAAVSNIRQDCFPIADIFVVGIEVTDIFKLPAIKSNTKTRQKYAELFEKQYTEFYLMITRAAIISYVLLFLPLAFLFGAMTNEVAMVVLVLLVPAVLALYVKMNIGGKIKEQRDEILLDYPNVLSKLALLINAGMMLREAWATVAESGNRKLYREMQNVTKKVNNGYSDIRAYEELADACRINEIKKFVSIICQNTEKGSSELTHILKELSVDAWTLKKNLAKVKGDAASGKLIIPVAISFIAILIMIMVPIMSGMQNGI